MTDAPINPANPQPTFHSSMCLCRDTGFRTYMRGGNSMKHLRAMAVPAAVPFVYEWEIPCKCTVGDAVNKGLGRWEDIPGIAEQRLVPRYDQTQMERNHSYLTFYDSRHDAKEFILECHRLFVIKQMDKAEVLSA